MSQFGLLHRRECTVPTWRGWLALAVALALAGFAFVRGIYGYLAVQDPVPDGILVVEGWAPDYALAAALEEFRAHHYDGIFTTGVPLDQGQPLSEYKTGAELGAAILIRLGADPAAVHAVPSMTIRRDRTFGSATTLRDWLHEHGVSAKKVNIVTVGPHARRTRFLAEKAFGPGTRVGVIAIEPRDFEPRRWWRSSQGFRVVVSEVIAWLYARLLFRPAVEAEPIAGLFFPVATGMIERPC